MRPHTHRCLAEIRAAAGMEYGKLVQKLLAVAFLDAGVDTLTERSTQGIDLEVRFGGRARAFEVKTAAGNFITLGAKDLAGLQRQIDAGLTAHIAILFDASLLEEWLMVRYHPGEIQARKQYTSFALRPYRDRDLEEHIRDTFDAAVARHVNVAIAGGQKGLDEILERYSNRQIA